MLQTSYIFPLKSELFWFAYDKYGTFMDIFRSGTVVVEQMFPFYFIFMEDHITLLKSIVKTHFQWRSSV